MAFSVNDKVKKLVSDPRAKAVLVKHHPALVADPTFPMTYGMSFKSLAAFPQVGMGQEMLDAIEDRSPGHRRLISLLYNCSAT